MPEEQVGYRYELRVRQRRHVIFEVDYECRAQSVEEALQMYNNGELLDPLGEIEIDTTLVSDEQVIVVINTDLAGDILKDK